MRSKKYQKLEEERLAAGEELTEAAEEAVSESAEKIEQLTGSAAAAEAMASHEKPQGFLKKVKAMKMWQKVLCLALIVVLVGTAGAYAFVNQTLNKVNKTKLDRKKLSCVDIDGYVNIALLGVDSRSMKKKDIKGKNTDCIIVVSMNTKTKKVNLISLYRDTYLRLNGTDTYNKVNAAYAWGGAEGAITTLNQNLDLNIENYVLFNFKMVSDLVNEVGGIRVTIEDYEIEELNKYTKETAHIVGQKKYKLVKKPGKQKLEGVQAVAYGRIRKGVGDDFKRTSRMRLVVQKVTKKLQKMSIRQLLNIMDMMLPQIETSLSNNDMIAIAQRLSKYEFDQSVGFPYDVTTGYLDGISYVFPVDLAGNVKRLHEELFGQEDYQVSETLSGIAGTADSASSGSSQTAPEGQDDEFGSYQQYAGDSNGGSSNAKSTSGSSGGKKDSGGNSGGSTPADTGGGGGSTDTGGDGSTDTGGGGSTDTGGGSSDGGGGGSSDSGGESSDGGGSGESQGE